MHCHFFCQCKLHCLMLLPQAHQGRCNRFSLCCYITTMTLSYPKKVCMRHHLCGFCKSLSLSSHFYNYYCCPVPYFCLLNHVFSPYTFLHYSNFPVIFQFILLIVFWKNFKILNIYCVKITYFRRYFSIWLSFVQKINFI